METIAGELGASALPEPMRSVLIEQQYAVRRQANARGRIVEADGTDATSVMDAGWLVTTTTNDAVYVVEIMILPKLRGQGIGTAVVLQLMTTAGESGKPVRLNVNVTNQAAIRFYSRLGFRRIGGDEVQDWMEWP